MLTLPSTNISPKFNSWGNFSYLSESIAIWLFVFKSWKILLSVPLQKLFFYHENQRICLSLYTCLYFQNEFWMLLTDGFYSSKISDISLIWSSFLFACLFNPVVLRRFLRKPKCFQYSLPFHLQMQLNAEPHFILQPYFFVCNFGWQRLCGNLSSWWPGGGLLKEGLP